MMNNSGTILEDENGKRYFLPNGTSETIPNRIMLKAVDENGNDKTDGHGRSVVKMFNSIELLQSMRDKRMRIVGFIN